MGVPTLTLAGQTLLSRQGASLMTCVGLPGWVTHNAADYVARAVQHASDMAGLASLRAALRQQVLNTPLFNGALFASQWQDAIEAIWRARTKAMAGGVPVQL